MACGRPITAGIAGQTKQVSLRCQSCAELQTVPEGVDPRVATCTNCGHRLRRLEEGKRYLIVANRPGYRVSWQSAVGGFSNSLIEDNLRRWSGDHIVDPEAVPGILFMNQNPHPVVKNTTRVGHPSGRLPNIIDLAPTILNYLEAPVPQVMEGKSLL